MLVTQVASAATAASRRVLYQLHGYGGEVGKDGGGGGGDAQLTEELPPDPD